MHSSALASLLCCAPPTQVLCWNPHGWPWPVGAFAASQGSRLGTDLSGMGCEEPDH